MPRHCCVRGCGNKWRTYTPITFHRLPKDHKRRKIWFAALNIDPATPPEVWKGLTVCSEHFTEEDYNISGQRLKDAAIPSAQRIRIQWREPQNIEQFDEGHLDLLEAEDAYSEGPLNSTPQKQKGVKLAPTWTKPLVMASSSTTMATHSPRRSLHYEDPHLTGATAMDTSATSSLFDASMTSETGLDPADSSFVPETSPSTSATGSSTSLSGQPSGWKERKWIVNESKLMELFQTCPSCASPMCDVNQTVSHCGSRIKIKWQCNNGHKGQWDSCPEVRGMQENNIVTQAAVVFTGATYTDIADWARLVNLQLPQKSWFNVFQGAYLLPVIEEAYVTQEDIVKARLICQTADGERVDLCGDGRSDSPGHSSKYNTYSFMDDSTKQIVRFELTQVSQASSSTAMEPLGFRKGLENILNEGIDVRVVTTDRHPSIRKIMREEYPHICHQFDPWHVVKGFRKKLVDVSNRRENRDLAPWVRSISNHIWWSCCTCGGDPEELFRRWMSLLHHIAGVHRWEDGGIEYKCFHQELSAEEQNRKMWLSPISPPYKALKTMMTITRFRKDLQQMALFKHTGQLEVFHNTLLKYCPKRLHFEYPAMKARTMLAIMDHNENHCSEREQARTAAGLPRTNVVHKKQTGRWISRPVYVETTQAFRNDLMDRVLQRRLDPSVRPKDRASHMVIPQLPANIARVPKPSKEEADKLQTSRFRGPPKKE